MKKILKDKKIIYVYTGDHPVHRAFAETVTKESVHISEKIPSGYDIYLTEGTYVLPVILKLTGLLGRNAKVITLFAENRLYYLKHRKRFNREKNTIEEMSLLRRLIYMFCLKKLDGAICEGDSNIEIFREFDIGVPYVEVDPFIRTEWYTKLKKFPQPELKNKNILFVGNGPDYYYKGLDLLIKSTKKLRETDNGYHLYILGKYWENIGLDLDGVHFEGYQSITKYLDKCSLLVHVGRGEGFGINIIDAMLAGVPALVSDKTGAKGAVAKVSDNLIVGLNEKEVCDAIENYFSLNIKDRLALAKKSKNVASEFDKGKILAKFKLKFLKLLEGVYRK